MAIARARQTARIAVRRRWRRSFRRTRSSSGAFSVFSSGGTYDPITKTWSGPKDGVRFGDYAYQWMEAGVSAIGGCCQTVADHIRQVTEARKRFLKRG